MVSILVLVDGALEAGDSGEAVLHTEVSILVLVDGALEVVHENRCTPKL